MGSLTIQVIGDASVGTLSKTYAIADADVNRLVAYCKATYPTTPPAPAQTTPGALQAWADGFKNGTVNNVLAYEQSNASTTAKAAVNPITAT